MADTIPQLADRLEQSLADARAAGRISGAKNSYRRDNPTEYTKVMAYLDGGPRPTGTLTKMGEHLVLEEDVRIALVRYQPTPSPPGSALSVDPNTMLALGGTILREDTAAAADPEAGLWGNIEAQSDTRHVYKTTGGSTHLRANGTPQGNTAYRELTLMDGDDFFGERVELGRNERSNGENTGSQTSGTFALYREGEHKLTFWSMRFGSGFDRAAADFQTIMQMKQTQGYVASEPPDLPVFHVECAYDTKLHFYDKSGIVFSCTAPALGVWFRVATDIVYSKDPSIGRVQVYVDTDGDGIANFTSSVLHQQTLAYCTSAGNGLSVGDPIPSHLRIGNYSGVTNSGTRVVDIDNVQVVG